MTGLRSAAGSLEWQACPGSANFCAGNENSVRRAYRATLSNVPLDAMGSGIGALKVVPDLKIEELIEGLKAPRVIVVPWPRPGASQPRSGYSSEPRTHRND